MPIYTMGRRHFGERRYIRITGKKNTQKETSTIEYIVVDVTESPINRPKNNQKEYYSGKKNAIR